MITGENDCLFCFTCINNFLENVVWVSLKFPKYLNFLKIFNYAFVIAYTLIFQTVKIPYVNGKCQSNQCIIRMNFNISPEKRKFPLLLCCSQWVIFLQFQLTLKNNEKLNSLMLELVTILIFDFFICKLPRKIYPGISCCRIPAGEYLSIQCITCHNFSSV